MRKKPSKFLILVVNGFQIVKILGIQAKIYILTSMYRFRARDTALLVWCPALSQNHHVTLFLFVYHKISSIRECCVLNCPVKGKYIVLVHGIFVFIVSSDEMS